VWCANRHNTPTPQARLPPLLSHSGAHNLSFSLGRALSRVSSPQVYNPDSKLVATVLNTKDSLPFRGMAEVRSTAPSATHPTQITPAAAFFKAVARHAYLKASGYAIEA